MSADHPQMSLAALNLLDAEQRFNYLVETVAKEENIWILTDEHGCVMLTTDDQDCIPVWPSQALASVWAIEEWQHCQPQAISLGKWHSRWTPGLEDDELAIVVFPNQDEEGMIVEPDEFDLALSKASKKLLRRNN
jgi:hypothetical protein